jgi:hypothetical protein
VLWAHGAAVCHLERDGLRYLVPLSAEVNPLFGFAWLESFLTTLKEYLGDVTEVTVKDNFDVVYMVSWPEGRQTAGRPSEWSDCARRADVHLNSADTSSSRRCSTRGTR